MQVIHRISFSATPADQRDLATLGFAVASHGFVTLQVDESHPHWAVLDEWIRARKAVDIINTEFTSEEVGAARWLALMPSWHHGYPQPREGQFGYRQATYDLTHYCESCGVGATQKAPFQMKGEPKWGQYGLLQLNWVFDEYFVTPQVWMSVFKPARIQARAVTNTKGVELRTVLQLVVTEQVAMLSEGLPGDACLACSRRKLLPVTRGPLPGLEREPTAPMVRTQQYFGSGGSAYNGILVSQQLAHTLLAQNVRGAAFSPLKTPSAIPHRIALCPDT